MTNRSLLVQLAAGFFLLGVTLLLCELSRIDLWVQDKFYISGAAGWVIGKHDELLRVFFYTGPKAALKILAGLALVAVIFSRKIPWVHNRKQGMLIVLLSTVVTVTLVGLLKGATHVPCPSQLTLYDGSYPYSTFWAHLLSPEQAARARCFPAGHASGGFALLSLAFLFRSRKNRWIGFGIGMALGWTLGVYKMAIGDHFLSHTLVTMCLAWIVSVLVAMAVFRLYGRLPAGTVANTLQSP
ncbi:phosphatase PAP2 family protein [Microbulbifer pacificus]|uniref:Phosphatase PAP2 family protein n=1 Tax=Microbulbifer pacificus TaxID=407164 RepID=A0AAU0N111_9GAMM|nr:phosphatase PAP2 family protein [Microbulbifer pacificus]WOX05817.1 phosphatase PAP2 family protein [Microbulbifer pacificus]